MYTNMYIRTMQFGPLMSPRLPVRVRLLPGQFQNVSFLWVLAGSENDRNLSFARSNLGCPACELVVGRPV